MKFLPLKSTENLSSQRQLCVIHGNHNKGRNQITFAVRPILINTVIKARLTEILASSLSTGILALIGFEAACRDCC